MPAVGEALPGYVFTSWLGLFAPAGTPAPAVARISREVAAALRAGPTRERLEQLGYEPVGSTPEEFAAFFAAELPGSPSWCASPARPWTEGGGQPMRVRDCRRLSGEGGGSGACA